MAKNDVKQSAVSEKNERLISLLDHYQAEWMHRDSMYYSQGFKYFSFSLVATLLPNIPELFYSGLELDTRYSFVFRVVGLAIAIFFLIVSLGNAERSRAVNDTYIRLNNLLPEYLRRNPLKRFGWRTGNLKTWFLFALLAAAAIGMMLVDFGVL